MAGFGVDVDGGQPAMPVPEERSGHGTGPKTKLCAGFDDVVGLGGRAQAVPADTSGPVRLLGAFPPARIGRQPFRHFADKVFVAFQFPHPGTYLTDLRPADGGNEPTKLIDVEGVQVVCEVSGLAATHEPIDRSPNDMCVVARHHRSAQWDCYTTGNWRIGDAAPEFLLHYVAPSGIVVLAFAILILGSLLVVGGTSNEAARVSSRRLNLTSLSPV